MFGEATRLGNSNKFLHVLLNDHKQFLLNPAQTDCLCLESPLFNDLHSEEMQCQGVEYTVFKTILDHMTLESLPPLNEEELLKLVNAASALKIPRLKLAYDQALNETKYKFYSSLKKNDFSETLDLLNQTLAHNPDSPSSLTLRGL